MEAAATVASNSKSGSRLLPAYWALIVGIVCVAWSAIFGRWTDIPGPASASYRMLIPGVALLPTFLFDRQGMQLNRHMLGIIALGGLFFALDLALYNTSILKTSAANATLLGNNTPIVVGLLSWFVFRKRPAATFWLGLAMALAGTAVILRSDLGKHMQFGTGDAMALGAAVCFAVYLLATERVRTSTTTLGFLRLAMISSTMALFVINRAMGISVRVPHGRTLWAIWGLGLLASLGAI